MQTTLSTTFLGIVNRDIFYTKLDRVALIKLILPLKGGYCLFHAIGSHGAFNLRQTQILDGELDTLAKIAIIERMSNLLFTPHPYHHAFR